MTIMLMQFEIKFVKKLFHIGLLKTETHIYRVIINYCSIAVGVYLRPTQILDVPPAS
jgi:hypothetical protein